MAEVLKFFVSSCNSLKDQSPSAPLVGTLVSQYLKVRGEGGGGGGYRSYVLAGTKLHQSG